MNKKGIGLSINAIIILMLALITLTLILFFVSDMWGDIMVSMKSFPKLEIPPTSEDPMQFVPPTLLRGEKNKMTIGFYNNELGPITKASAVAIDCQNIKSIVVEGSSHNIPVGDSKKYLALVTIPETASPGRHICTMTISQTTKEFFLEIQ